MPTALTGGADSTPAAPGTEARNTTMHCVILAAGGPLAIETGEETLAIGTRNAVETLSVLALPMNYVRTA